MSRVNNNNINNKPIGVFDSGVGGLSVLLELQKDLPNENFVFLADQLYLPYGEKSKQKLVSRVYKISDYFIRQHDIKMMVVACNTATSNTIVELRKKYNFPIVGTIPAIKVAAQKTKTKSVAIISTVSTSKSLALNDLIKNYCVGVNTINIGCRGLVELVEQGELSGNKVSNLILKYLEPVVDYDVDYLVLGCTHYPFLKKAIKKIVGRKVVLLDSGKAIARQTKSLLIKHNINNPSSRAKLTTGQIKYFTTGDALKFSKISNILLHEKIDVKKIKI
ncbi:MAG: glutamate racemase [bacterium]